MKYNGIKNILTTGIKIYTIPFLKNIKNIFKSLKMQISVYYFNLICYYFGICGMRIYAIFDVFIFLGIKIYLWGGIDIFLWVDIMKLSGGT